MKTNVKLRWISGVVRATLGLVLLAGCGGNSGQANQAKTVSMLEPTVEARDSDGAVLADPLRVSDVEFSTIALE